MTPAACTMLRLLYAWDRKSKGDRVVRGVISCRHRTAAAEVDVNTYTITIASDRLDKPIRINFHTRRQNRHPYPTSPTTG
jgi:hypothetical protein